MAEPQRFTARIEGAGGGAFVSVPFDVEAVYGKKRVPVRATFDGEPYRGSLVRMGPGPHMLLVRKDVRAAIGKDVGDTVEVVVEEDTAPREVEVPEDVRAALDSDRSASEFFDALSFTHRREYVEWVTGAKKAETRERRIAKMLEMLRAGQRGK